MPAALSTSRTPSGVVLDCCTSLFYDLFLYLRQCAATARPRRENMTATTKLLANRADIDRIVFRTHAHAHFSISQFFEENCHHDAANRAQVIDQPFIIFWKDAQLDRYCLAQTQPC